MLRLFRQWITSFEEAGCTEPAALRFAGRFSSKEDVTLYNVSLLTGERMVKLKFISSRHEVDQLDFMKFTWHKQTLSNTKSDRSYVFFSIFVCHVRAQTEAPDESDVYWIVHHCDSWRIKNQLDTTCYFIFLPIDSTCFGHYYAHHQELATMLLNYHIGRFVLLQPNRT